MTYVFAATKKATDRSIANTTTAPLSTAAFSTASSASNATHIALTTTNLSGIFLKIFLIVGRLIH